MLSQQEDLNTFTEIDLRLAIDPAPPPGGNFVHYDFLKLQYISHKMRHVSPLRVERYHATTTLHMLPYK